MKVIAISGFKRSGKDTSADFMVNSYNFKRVGFADPLKDMVAKYFDIPREWLDNPDFKEKPLLQYPAPTADKFTSTIANMMAPEFRSATNFQADPSYTRSHEGVLQTFHNEWVNLYHTPRSLAILMGSSMRAGDSAFWVKKAIKDIKQIEQTVKYANVVISDLRYKSEAKQLKDAFGENLITIRVNRFDTSPSQDASEIDLVDFKHDFTLENKGSLEELYGKIRVVLLQTLS